MGVVDFDLEGTIGVNLQPKRYDIVLYAGDTFKFDLTFQDSVPAAIDVSLWTWDADVQAVDYSPVTPKPAISVANKTDGTDGVVTVTIDSSGLTFPLTNTPYMYDIQATDGSGNVRTFIGGQITITRDISDGA